MVIVYHLMMKTGNQVFESKSTNSAEKNDGISTDSYDNRGHVRVYRWRYFSSEDIVDDYNYTTRDGAKPLIITPSTSTAPEVGYYYWTQLGGDIDW